jgi:hypothetical protein
MTPANGSYEASRDVNQAVDYLRGLGYREASHEAVARIEARHPWLKRRNNGWQQLVQLYVEHPEWRDLEA